MLDSMTKYPGSLFVSSGNQEDAYREKGEDQSPVDDGDSSAGFNPDEISAPCSVDFESYKSVQDGLRALLSFNASSDVVNSGSAVDTAKNE